MEKVLIIDDDLELCRLLASYLGREGLACVCIHDGESGLEAALDKAAGFDLVILDVMLPLKNGFDVLRGLRNKDTELPVIMLTAKGEAVDRIVGLEMGADDYLPKPFDPRELLARVRSVGRRASGRPGRAAEGQVEVDELVLDYHALQGECRGRSLNLTPVEFKVLRILVSQPGKVVPRDRLFREALGRCEHSFDRSLDMHISRIRKKIWPDSSGMERIRNIRGEGYLYVPSRPEMS